MSVLPLSNKEPSVSSYMDKALHVEVGVSATSMSDEMSFDTLHFFGANIMNPLVFRGVCDTSGNPLVRSVMEVGDPPVAPFGGCPFVPYLVKAPSG
jgi:hypothetical protein